MCNLSNVFILCYITILQEFLFVVAYRQSKTPALAANKAPVQTIIAYRALWNISIMKSSIYIVFISRATASLGTTSTSMLRIVLAKVGEPTIRGRKTELCGFLSGGEVATYLDISVMILFEIMVSGNKVKEFQRPVNIEEVYFRVGHYPPLGGKILQSLGLIRWWTLLSRIFTFFSAVSTVCWGELRDSQDSKLNNTLE